MRANFAKAAAAGDEAPLWFYAHLFLTHPETRQLFPVSMAHQRDRLFAALGEVVARVDDLDSLVPILQQLGRDHRKFGTVTEHYPAVGASLLATLEHFDEEWDEALAADWTAAYELVASVMVQAADEMSDQPPWWDAEVVAHERRTVDTAVLRLRSKVPLPYRPGESISLETELRPRLWRYYSPANAFRPDGELEIHARAQPGGPVSTALVRQVHVGDVLRLGPPVDHMRFDPDSDRDLLLVAGGTGLAPLKAIVDHVARNGAQRRVDLFVGVRLEEDLYDREDLTRLAQDNPWLTVTVAVSEDEHTQFAHGDVGEVVARSGPWGSREAYVAGPPAMVDDTVGRLRQQGLPEERIRTEVFAPSRPGPDVHGEVTT
ncbi:NAD(P)H-flavin reductase [Geodermatophilus saharensis]|uniref:nitric oxide dioxygenase n=2 Tax=Geodermatophilus saharensis TaxID=1137994 RepID=A0A239CSD3_9ACTN|nr:NAD(P)H-flavin reductase [Geodermatophilus saharensis]